MNGRTDLKKGTIETFGSDGYDNYFDFGDGWVDACICQNPSNCTLQICGIYCVSIMTSIKLFKKRSIIHYRSILWGQLLTLSQCGKSCTGILITKSARVMSMFEKKNLPLP